MTLNKLEQDHKKTNPFEYQEGGAVMENKDGISESREKPFVKTVDEDVSTNIKRKNVTVSMAIAKVDVENSAPIHTSEASGILVIQEGIERDRVMENKDGKSATREAVNISICGSDMCPLDHGVVESVKEQSDVAYGTMEEDDSTRMSQHISEISVPEIPVMKSEGWHTQSKKKISPRRVCCQTESGSREIVIGTIEMQDEETKTIESQKDARHAMEHGKIQKRKRKPLKDDPDFIPPLSEQLSSVPIKKESSRIASQKKCHEDSSVKCADQGDMGKKRIYLVGIT